MAENEFENGEEVKKSPKMIIIIGVVLLLLGGGAAYYFTMGSSSSEDGEQSEQLEDENSDEEEAAGGEAVYYDMNKPLIVNFPKGSGASLIQVSVSLLAMGEDTVEALKKHEPMIRNNFLMAISAKGAEKLMTREGKDALGADMLTEVGEIMTKMTGKNKVTNVFFTTFVMQ